MNALTRWVVLTAEHTDTRQRTLAFGRSLIAVGQLSVMLFSPDAALFDDFARPPSGLICDGVRAAGLWCSAGSSDHGLLVSRVISIGVLLLVLVGFRPRWTCVPHWYVAFSFAANSPVSDAGDSIAQIATMLLIPICLGDNRVWQWSSPTSQIPPMWRGSGAASLLALRGQIIVIYLTAVGSKLMDPFWRNGTALPLVAADHLFGFPQGIRRLLQPLLDTPPLLAAATWSVITAQVVIAACITLPGSERASRIALALGVCLHVAIGALMNLTSFGLIMVGLLVIATSPLRPLRTST